MLNKKLAGALGAGIFALGIAASAAPAQAAIQTVTTTASSGNGSLRDAITTANQAAGRDTILFQIQGAGPHVISLANGLPAITGPVAIRGYSEPSSSPATPNAAADPSVFIDATNAVNGLVLTASDSEVRGLVINDAQVDGIRVLGNRNVLAGNYLGTDGTSGAGVSNTDYGMHVDGSDNVIGGPAVADRNVISNNGIGGVLVHGSGNVVEGSYLGTDETGAAGIGGGGVDDRRLGQHGEGQPALVQHRRRDPQGQRQHGAGQQHRHRRHR